MLIISVSGITTNIFVIILSFMWVLHNFFFIFCQKWKLTALFYVNILYFIQHSCGYIFGILFSFLFNFCTSFYTIFFLTNKFWRTIIQATSDVSQWRGRVPEGDSTESCHTGERRCWIFSENHLWAFGLKGSPRKSGRVTVVILFPIVRCGYEWLCFSQQEEWYRRGSAFVSYMETEAFLVSVKGNLTDSRDRTCRLLPGLALSFAAEGKDLRNTG